MNEHDTELADLFESIRAETWPPVFHPAPYGEIAAQVDDPQNFINKLYRAILEARPYFPGSTNYTGRCLDSVVEQLEEMGATTEFDDV